MTGSEHGAPEILFLVGDTAIARNDNHLRLPRAFGAAGWTVTTLPHDALALHAGELHAGHRPAAGFTLIWPLGFGRANTFLDRMQLLREVPPERLVVPVDALVYRHAKYAWRRLMPETHAGNDVDALLTVLERGGDWVAKPTAGSYGREVTRLRAGPGARAALTALTGGPERRYCLLQRYAESIERGEKRTLVAGGAIVGSYLRLPGADFRTNLALTGRALPTVLDGPEREMVETLAAELLAERIGFAAIDIAWPYLMEVNLANPGGLGTLATLYRDEPEERAAAAVMRWASNRKPSGAQ